LAVEGLQEEDFFIVTEFQPFHPVPHVTAWAFPAYHCDGSVMFLFELNGDHDDDDPKKKMMRILYTGDFRFHQDFYRNDLLMDNTIDRLYYDDVFDEIDVDYPSYDQSLTQFTAAVALLQDKGHRRIYVNASILGLEPLLRSLSQALGYPFGLSVSLRDTWRGRQLKYLLGDALDENHVGPVTLGHRNHDDDGSGRHPWVIPTCTFFLCDDRHKQMKKPYHFHVWFCTHSNQLENNRFKALVGANEVNPCQGALTKLKCQKGDEEKQ
jgi:hypothetical protein